MDVSRPPSLDVSDYLGMARRHWWIAALAVAAGLGGAAVITSHLPREYLSITSVLVQPAGDETNAVGGRTKGEINLDTEAQLLQSTAVASGAGEMLRTAESPRDLAKHVSVEVPPNSTVLQIRYAARTPEQAQAGSHAFAESYLSNRDANAKFELTSQINALNAKVKQLNGQLAQINAKLNSGGRESANRDTLDSQRGTILVQINQLTGKLNGLTTATVRSGRIISDAGLPNRPVKPDPMVNLATGAMAGLLLGIAIAALRHRLDRKCRRRSDVERRGEVPVLAEVPGRARPRFDDVFAPNDLGGRTFNRLRNEVIAAMSANGITESVHRVAPRNEGRVTRQGDTAPIITGVAHPGDAAPAYPAQVIVVTGASRGTASTIVAANLAAALARTGSDVILVGARQPESLIAVTPLARVIGVHPTPGLSDVLTGRIELNDALQRAPRAPSLRVLPTGGTATAGGVLQSQTLRDTVLALRLRCEYVVIEAPSTATGADAQSLAGVSDAAIIAIELRRTTHPQVRDASEQLQRVATPVLGAVIVPRLKPPAQEPTAAPAAAIDTIMLQRLDDETLAALDAARDAARDSARDAAKDSAKDAARDAAKDSASDSGKDASRVAARGAKTPVRTEVPARDGA
jgi:uncharacterized protein involved in exopolysaccharide biosynthesis/Mrp family chromosome partitioning ATPase